MDWVNIDERIPERSGYYLIYIQSLIESEESKVRPSYYYKTSYNNSWFRLHPLDWGKHYLSDNEFKECDSKGNETKVTHWMELPEPPIDNKKKEKIMFEESFKAVGKGLDIFFNNLSEVVKVVTGFFSSKQSTIINCPIKQPEEKIPSQRDYQDWFLQIED